MSECQHDPCFRDDGKKENWAHVSCNCFEEKYALLEKKVEKLREALEAIASDEMDKLVEYKKKHHLQSLFVMDDVSDVAKAALSDGSEK